MKNTLLSKIKNLLFLSIPILVIGCGGAKEKEANVIESVVFKTEQSSGTISKKSTEPSSNKKTVSSRDDFVLNELNDELKKVRAELKYVTDEVKILKAKSEIWANPISVYNKEIIMDNGSTIFGQIIYQDKKVIKVETLVGHLILNRANVVRIVENIPDDTV